MFMYTNVKLPPPPVPISSQIPVPPPETHPILHPTVPPISPEPHHPSRCSPIIPLAQPIKIRLIYDSKIEKRRETLIHHVIN